MKSKWTTWYDQLPSHTKAHLTQQAIWHDRDIFKFATIAFVLGIFVGLAV